MNQSFALKSFAAPIATLLAVCALSACAPSNSSVPAPSATAQALASNKMPTLHKIETHTFEKPYGCTPFVQGYKTSALFVSELSRKNNSPELLLNGTCQSQSPSYFVARTAGDDFALISDLGDVPIESVSAHKAFNYVNISRQENTFKDTANAFLNHTYAVLITKNDIRALYVFRVTEMTADYKVTIQYSVKSYSLQNRDAEVQGFEWEKGNK